MKRVKIEVLNKIIEIEVHSFSPSFDAVMRSVSNKMNAMFYKPKYKIIEIF